MNCLTHKDTPLQYAGTIADIYICPKCVRERQAPVDPEKHIIEIPFSGITLDDLKLFDQPELDFDRRVVIVRERI